MTILNIKKSGLTMAAACCFALGTFTAAPADADAAEARAMVRINGAEVTLGDLFTDTGDLSDVYVADAPLPGERKYISGPELSGLALRYELDWKRPSSFSRATIERTSSLLSEEELRMILEHSIIENGGPDRFTMTLFGMNNSIHLPVNMSSSAIEVSTMNIDPRTNRFTAVVQVPINHEHKRSINLSGRLEVLDSIPVLTRAVLQGEIITADEISWQELPRQRIGQNILLTSGSVIGQQARRNLRPDQPLRGGDLRNPVLVEKGALITMRIQAGSMTLTAIGRAMEDGGKNDIVRLVNIDSHQTVEGRVIGPDQIEILRLGSLAMANR